MALRRLLSFLSLFKVSINGSFQIGKHKAAMVEAFHSKQFVGNRAALVGVGIDHARLLKYADILKLNKGAGWSILCLNIVNVTSRKTWSMFYQFSLPPFIALL